MLHLAFSGFGLLGSFDALLVEGFECFGEIQRRDQISAKMNTRQRPSRLSNFGISAFLQVSFWVFNFWALVKKHKTTFCSLFTSH